MEYQEFLKTKRHIVGSVGKEVSLDLIHANLFDWQKVITRWAIRKGRCAVFLDTGLGKTRISLEYARLLGENTLIVAPLSVARQTVREGTKVDLAVQYVRNQGQVTGDNKLWITNYEMIDSFDFTKFGAVVLDESSILKCVSGQTRKKLTSLCKDIPYKLCCTATPAPNDYTEIGNHAEFLGICTIPEMLATFFINANKEHTQYFGDTVYRRKGSNKNGTEWRIKHHAEDSFFEWLASWAITMTRPSDLNYDDDGFILPELRLHPEFVKTEYKGDQLFFTKLHGIADRANTRRGTLEARLGSLSRILDNGNGLGVNLQYADERTTKNIQQEILPRKQGKREEAESIILSGAQARDSEETRRVHDEILSCPQRELEQKNTRKGGNPQPTKARKICNQSRIKGEYKGESAGMVQRQSREEKGAEASQVWDNSGAVRRNNEASELCLCDMRDDRCEQLQGVSPCGSQPCDRKDTGNIVHELQSSSREVQGQSEFTVEGIRLPQWIIWCGLDIEQRAIESTLDKMGISFVSVFGSLPLEEKANRIEDWIDGKCTIIVSKSKVCGFGMNFQQAHNMIFFGLGDSWEVFYQAVRREWRYGQTQPVDVYVIMSDVEQEIYENVMRKDAMAKRLREKLIEKIRIYERRELGMSDSIAVDYTENTVKGNGWTQMLGDSCERLKEIPDNSCDLSIHSPPFCDLFVYSASDRDLGNSKGKEEFFDHYSFIIRELLRVTKDGRVACVHTSDIPAMAQKDGYIGLKDFPGDVIRAYQKEGWIFHGRITISKNPQAQAVRIHSKALAFGQLRRDSSDCRPALIDQVLVFKKPGENLVPVTPVANGEMDNETWIIWANGVWTGIRETETLQYAQARGNEDERHICPLQLETIERCIKLYSNPKEMVIDPFGGIGSTGYQALKFGRKTILIELKPEYFATSVKNLKEAEVSKKDMFSQSGMAV